MRPRLIAVDNVGKRLFRGERAEASMRPRLIAVDNAEGALVELALAEASMRPRLIAVDNGQVVRSLFAEKPALQ